MIRKIIIGVFSIAMCACILIKPTIADDELTNQLFLSLLVHLLGSVVFALLCVTMNYRIFQKTTWRAISTILPCLLVVLNNLPFIPILKGTASVVRFDLLWLYALDALFIGVFEELTFRGVFFLYLLEDRRSSKRQIFWVTVVSSALFALCHLANLIEGAGFGGTILQVGYSFLIGGMCSYAFLKTKNIVIPIVLHALFDFCGNLLMRLGEGKWLDTETIVLTTVLALLCTAHVIVGLVKVEPSDVQSFYPDGNNN